MTEVIGEGPDDKPLPKLSASFSIVEQRPIHILIALCAEKKYGIIVTVYEPDSNIWHIDFKPWRKTMTCIICKHGHTKPGFATVTLLKVLNNRDFQKSGRDLRKSVQYYLPKKFPGESF
ncbi:MAG: hypothetical protein R3C26_02490 [Calditrichia bacterium]